MSDGVLPGSLVGAVVWEPLHDELVDARQGDPLLGALLDGHGYQSYVADGHTHTVQSSYIVCPVIYLFPKNTEREKKRVTGIFEFKKKKKNQTICKHKKIFLTPKTIKCNFFHQ